MATCHPIEIRETALGQIWNLGWQNEASCKVTQGGHTGSRLGTKSRLGKCIPVLERLELVGGSLGRLLRLYMACRGGEIKVLAC